MSLVSFQHGSQCVFQVGSVHQVFTLSDTPPFPRPLPLQVRVGSDITNVQLERLTPETEYSITVYALDGEAVSEPLEGRGVTCTSQETVTCSLREFYFERLQTECR